MSHFSFDMGMSTFSGYDGDGFISISVDGTGDQAACPPFELHSPASFYSRPRDPDIDSNGNPTAGCNILYAWEGNTGHAFAMSDPRAIQRLPQVKKGGAVMYADTGETGKPSFQMFDGDNGSWQLYIGYGTSAMVISVDVSQAGTENIQLRHGLGMGVSIAAGGKNSVVLNNKAGNAYVEINDDGVNINGQAVALLGGVSVGDPRAAKPLMMATDLLAWIGQVNAALATCALTGTGGGSPTTTITALPTAVPIPATMLKGS